MTAHPAFARDVARMLRADFAQAREIGRDEFLASPALLRVAMRGQAVRPHSLSDTAADVVHIRRWRSCTVYAKQNEWTMSTWG